jgi:hypothetical protein
VSIQATPAGTLDPSGRSVVTYTAARPSTARATGRHRPSPGAAGVFIGTSAVGAGSATRRGTDGAGEAAAFVLGDLVVDIAGIGAVDWWVVAGAPRGRDVCPQAAITNASSTKAAPFTRLFAAAIG